MNYTKAKIFNMTLKNLGISTGVQSYNQEDRNTVVLNEYYETALYKTLNDFDWGFASVYAELTPALNTAPHPKYQYCYDYPNSCLKIREVYHCFNPSPLTPQGERGSINTALPRGEGEQSKKYRCPFETASGLDGNKIIYTDISPALARYTRIINNETLFPPEFVSALSQYLAFLSAASITGARSKTSDCLQLYKQMLKEAYVSDANEQYKNDDFENEYIEARG